MLSERLGPSTVHRGIGASGVLSSGALQAADLDRKILPTLDPGV